MKVILLVPLFLVIFTNTINSKEPKSKWVSRKCKVIATAYCPCEVCCGIHADGRTAIGKDAKEAGVAVDPELFKLGQTRFDVPQYPRGKNRNGSWIPADDTGRAIRGFRIDVRFETHEEALEWGRKTLTVRVWERIDE